MKIWGISKGALAIACAAPVTAQAQPVATPAAAVHFDIGASDLRSALSHFSRVTGMQVVVAPAMVSGRRTSGVRGAFTTRAALDQLLRGTSLVASVRGGVAILKPQANPSVPRPIPAAAVRPAPVVQDSASYVSGASDELSTEEVIVTGFRQSIAEAQQLKRNAVGAEDDIVATDIAAFPDLTRSTYRRELEARRLPENSVSGATALFLAIGWELANGQRLSPAQNAAIFRQTTSGLQSSPLLRQSHARRQQESEMRLIIAALWLEEARARTSSARLTKELSDAVWRDMKTITSNDMRAYDVTAKGFTER
ncbi:secretin and TonB N-terminal domain-containing protein [Sphingomonas olei]